MKNLLIEFEKLVDTCDFENNEDDSYLLCLDLIREEYYKGQITWQQRAILTKLIDDLQYTLKEAVLNVIDYIKTKGDT